MSYFYAYLIIVLSTQQRKKQTKTKVFRLYLNLNLVTEGLALLNFTTDDPTIYNPTMPDSCINYPNKLKLESQWLEG